MEDHHRAGSMEGVLPSDAKHSSQYHCANTGGALCFWPCSSGLLVQPRGPALRGTVGNILLLNHFPVSERKL